MWQAVNEKIRRLAGRHLVTKRAHTAVERRLRKAIVAKDDVEEQLEQARQELNHIRAHYETWVPTGHFYSPYPDLDEVTRRASTIFDINKEMVGVDFKVDEQLAMFETMAQLLEEDLPFPADKGDEYRYYFDNPAYSWSDGMVLHAMLRHIKPRRIVEVGSGYSSAMTLDTTERWLDGAVDLVFVEPYTELLRSLLRPGDDDRVTIHEQAVQDVDLGVFTALEAGDVLFIDSTHVVKAGSDVNHLYFEVLPRLAEGVWIHIHDIFDPFEYAEIWVREGRAWHEAYLLRALLTFNDTFEIRWFQDYMWHHHSQLLESRLPLMAKNSGGNIWLQRAKARA
jgi:predicted O-methyltransferase YrrM